jgi:hypothetical protein
VCVSLFGHLDSLCMRLVWLPPGDGEACALSVWVGVSMDTSWVGPRASVLYALCFTHRHTTRHVTQCAPDLGLLTLGRYFFYKNCAVVVPLFLFGFQSLFSGQPLYDSWLLMFYNMAFTGWSRCRPSVLRAWIWIGESRTWRLASLGLHWYCPLSDSFFASRLPQIL